MAQESPRICGPDNWPPSPEAPSPRAVRWATRTLSSQFNDPNWGKWHYTEGNGCFTACGQAVQLFLVDGSPQEHRLDKVNCRRCLATMKRAGVQP